MTPSFRAVDSLKRNQASLAGIRVAVNPSEKTKGHHFPSPIRKMGGGRKRKEEEDHCARVNAHFIIFSSSERARERGKPSAVIIATATL